MKKIQLKGKLSLNKETIAKLNDEQMGNVVGGADSPITSKNVACGSGESNCISGTEPLSCRYACDPS